MGYLNAGNDCYSRAIKKLPESYKDILYWNDKNIMYEGQFKNGLFDGFGTFRDKSGKIIYKGYFRDGLIIA